MFKSKSYKLTCIDLLDQVEILYQNLRAELGLEELRMNLNLRENILTFLIEDALNVKTDSRFREPVELTYNYLASYFSNEIRIKNEHRETILKMFIKPMMDMTSLVVGKLLKTFDQEFTKYSVKITNEFPVMQVTYVCDYRIEQWHKEHDRKEALVTELTDGQDTLYVRQAAWNGAIDASII